MALRPDVVPIFRLPDLGLPSNSMLTSEQYQDLILLLRKINPGIGILSFSLQYFIFELNRFNLNILEMITFVFNNSKRFLDEFMTFIFVDIFRLTKINMFSFKSTLMTVSIEFRQQHWSSVIQVDDVQVNCTLNVGGQIGRYRVVKYLGQGTYGQVSLCLDESFGGKHCAAKVQQYDDHSIEIDAIGKINHPNIVRVIDSTENFRVLGKLYAAFFMPYYENETLLKFIKKTKPNNDHIMRILLNLMIALDHMINCGVVHCDIKPENIFVADDGTPVLGDLGLSKKLEPEKCIGTSEKPIYSIWYRPVIENNPKRGGYDYTGFSDLWSLLMSIMDVASFNPASDCCLFRNHPDFSVFRERDFQRVYSQQRIDRAIDSVFSHRYASGCDAVFGEFFKTYLNLRYFSQVQEEMRANPNLKSTIIGDAITRLKFLLGRIREEDGDEMFDVSENKTPIRPRLPFDEQDPFDRLRH